MNQRQNVGRRVASFEKYNEIGPITGIMLLVDDDSYYQAGNRSGYMMEVKCPYGSQQMANNLFASLQGKTYKGFHATDAEIDVSAELGDAVSVNGLYTMLAHSVLTFGPGHMSDISAPGSKEVEHEYPYISTTQKEFERQEAKAQSLIEKTAEQILLEVRNVKGEVNSLAVTVDGVTITGPSGTTNINGNTIATGTVNTTQLAAESVTSDKIYLEGLLAVYDPNGRVAGYIGYGASSIDGSYGINVYSSGGGGMVATSNGTKIQYAQSEVSATLNGVNVTGDGWTYYFLAGAFNPEQYSNPTLGKASNLWGQIYSTNSTVSTSDERLKNSIEDIPDKYLAMMDRLRPIRYKLNNGTSDRYHTGFSAQNVKAAMDSAGITSEEFGGFVQDVDADGNEILMLRYEEFIAIQGKKIQRLEERIARLEAALMGKEGE